MENKNSFMKIQDSKISKYLDEIKNDYVKKTKTIETLREELNNFKKETYKDEELSKMKNRLTEMEKNYYRGFPLSETEQKQIHEWIVNHENIYHGGYPCYHGASGGGYSYEFYPTGIGTFAKCICGSCKLKAFKEAKGDSNLYARLLDVYEAAFTFQDV